MKFSYLWLKELTGLKLTPAKLAEILTLRAFEIESMEKAGKDVAIDIKIPANRLTDAGGHIGLSREIAAVLGLKMKSDLLKGRMQGRGMETKGYPRITIESGSLCSRWTAEILRVDSTMLSPKWMQERLQTCGLRPLNAVIDVTNYIMLETGHPLHAFDFAKIRGLKMTIREAKAGEKLTTLDCVERILPAHAIVIEDGEGLIDLAGIMGGENSAVSEDTKTILLQAAVFDPVHILKTSQSLGLVSHASKLYAAGVDATESLNVLERAVTLLKNAARGKNVAAPFDWQGGRPRLNIIPFRPSYADQIIGAPIGAEFYVQTFKRLGFLVKQKGKDMMLVEVPLRRGDITLEEDLIEEAARLYGYERLPGVMPQVVLTPAKRNDEVFWEDRVRDIAVTSGFNETELYEFAGIQELTDFFIKPEIAIELLNPLNPETHYLTPRLLTKYIVSAKENAAHADKVRLFGIGKSFFRATHAKSGGTQERKDLIFATLDKNSKNAEQFYELKGSMDSLREGLGIAEWWYDDAIPEDRRKNEYRMFHPYRLAEIKSGDKILGVIGEIHPNVLDAIKSKYRIVAAEIYFDKLWRLASAESEYLPIGKYPSVRRDIAVLVPHTTRTEEILNIIENTGGETLQDADLFDYFQDEMMRESDRKSLAFHLMFQSPDRTLTDKEVDTHTEAVIRALEEKGWEVRK